MPIKLNPIDNIILEMKMIHLQLSLAKKSTKKHTLQGTLTEVEQRIELSRNCLSHLIENINDYKSSTQTKETHYEND